MTTAAEIESYRQPIKRKALELGLDPFETIFELIEFDEMNEVASYGGFPTRYPHWRFGMEYEQLAKGYTYGLQKIYELVINNNPCYAYLMKNNPPVAQKMVIAHVYGHSDFFKNNLWFAHTNRRMMDEMANHGTTIRRAMERYGEEPVEDFLDTCLSLENLIDFHAVVAGHRRRGRLEPEEEPELPAKLKSKDYMDRFVNPPVFLEQQKKKIEEAAKKRRGFPEEPQRDVLGFLMEHAPLEPWQRTLLDIVREEAYYFAPQALTKIMNEGWATYWHEKIMTTFAAEPSEIVDFADLHSGTLGTRPGAINPYKLGLELFHDIEERWNTGRFGPEWDRCDDLDARRHWDRKTGLGRKKLFEVRRIYNDLTFIDEFLTKDFCQEQKMFVFELNPETNRYEITDREFKKVKEQLLFNLTNMGFPIIRVKDGNFANRGELLLDHQHEGMDLDLKEGRDTLRSLFKLWHRPVHIETQVEGERKRVSFDGERHHEEGMGEA